jgi:NAD(P)-dependent dehydrogenase (short-subunit alcohol dehydrogenase family)
MDLGLKGKVVLVTGAGAGMGRTIALTFAQEGANVAINDLPPGSAENKRWMEARSVSEKAKAERVVQDCEKLGVKAITAYADVTDMKQVNEMVNAFIAELGQLDILVNNAGGGVGDIRFIDTTKEQWDITIALSLVSCLNCCKAVLPHMIERKWGKIVNLLSDAWKGADRRYAVYGATKAGVSSFTRTLALEVARYGINVNTVSPDWTDDVEWTIEAEKKRLDEIGEEAYEKRRQALMRLYPLSRFYGAFGTTEDIANMVVFVSSDRARWVTGQSISVTGGYHMH